MAVRDRRSGDQDTEPAAKRQRVTEEREGSSVREGTKVSEKALQEMIQDSPPAKPRREDTLPDVPVSMDDNNIGESSACKEGKLEEDRLGETMEDKLGETSACEEDKPDESGTGQESKSQETETREDKLGEATACNEDKLDDKPDESGTGQESKSQETDANKDGVLARRRAQLVVGVNAVTRLLERGGLEVGLVCASGPSLLCQHLLPLAATRGVAFAALPDLSCTVAALLGVKRVMCLGWKVSL